MHLILWDKLPTESKTAKNLTHNFSIYQVFEILFFKNKILDIFQMVADIMGNNLQTETESPDR